MFKRSFRDNILTQSYPQQLLIHKALILVLCVYTTQITSSAKQSVLVRKIDSTDRDPVLVTITGVAGDPIARETVKKDKKLKFDWAKGRNTIKARYSDGTMVPELVLSPEDAPKGSEITLDKQTGIALSLPVSVMSETIKVALLVPNNGQHYDIISGTEALKWEQATSKKIPPHVLLNRKTVIFGTSEKLEIFRHKNTKIYVTSEGDCIGSLTINPETLKKLGSRPLTLKIDPACAATLK